MLAGEAALEVFFAAIFLGEGSSFVLLGVFGVFFLGDGAEGCSTLLSEVSPRFSSLPLANAADGMSLPESPDSLSLLVSPSDSSLTRLLLDFFLTSVRTFISVLRFLFLGVNGLVMIPSADCLVLHFSSLSRLPPSFISIFRCASMSLTLCQMLKQLST